jgi:hypothetical protein
MHWGASDVRGIANDIEDVIESDVPVSETRFISDDPSSISSPNADSTAQRATVLLSVSEFLMIDGIHEKGRTNTFFHCPSCAPLTWISPSIAARSPSAPRKPFWKVNVSAAGTMKI